MKIIGVEAVGVTEGVYKDAEQVCDFGHLVGVGRGRLQFARPVDAQRDGRAGGADLPVVGDALDDSAHVRTSCTSRDRSGLAVRACAARATSRSADSLSAKNA